ncbi:MAG: lytic transglycosylase domain-containing protein [Candidatus Rokuibacteriota bacterium]
MPGQGLSNTPRRRGRPKPSHVFGGSVVQQVGGLVMLLLVIVPGYVMSRPMPEEWVPDAAVGAKSPAGVTNGRAATSAIIGEHIREMAHRYGVSEVLVASIIAVESEYNPRAVSRKGARGLMQLMPATASSLSVDDPFDPRENIEAGVRHLRRLMDRFDNNLPLVLAAYNAGETAVRRYRGVPPYRETRQYISRVLRKVERAQPGSVPARRGPTRLTPRNGLRASVEARPALLIVPVVYQPGLAQHKLAQPGLAPDVGSEAPSSFVGSGGAEPLSSQSP